MTDPTSTPGNTAGISEDLLLKIQKLLALGQSSNQNEAAVAIAKATKLLQEYNLDLAEVQAFGKPDEVAEFRDGIQDFTDKKWGKRASRQWHIYHKEKGPWIKSVARAIARANLCEIMTGSGHIWFVGPKRQLPVVNYMFYSVFNQMIELMRKAGSDYQNKCLQNYGTNAAQLRGEMHISVYQRSYMQGLVDAICRRLQEQTNEFAMEQRQVRAGENAGQSITGNELMIVTRSAIEQYFRQAYPEWYAHENAPVTKREPLTPEQEERMHREEERRQKKEEAYFKRYGKHSWQKWATQKLVNTDAVQHGRRDGQKVAFVKNGLKGG